METIPLPEVNTEPLGDLILNFLIDKDDEKAFIDFKETISIDKDYPFAKIAKDIFAFANYGGGYILVGYRENHRPKSNSKEVARVFDPIGLPPDFHIDQATLQEKFNAYSESPIEIGYREFTREVDGEPRKFAAIYIPASTCVMKPIKDGLYTDYRGKNKLAFNKGTVFIRRGTQSIPASNDEINWIRKRAMTQGYKISILSGKPDEIQENIVSNLFEVVKMPEVIWSADNQVATNEPIPNGDSLSKISVQWNNKAVSFSEYTISKPDLSKSIIPNTIRKEVISEWLRNPDKKRVIIWLHNKELSALAVRLGMLEEPQKHKFYYACNGESRTETWKPRFRNSSTLTVAKRLYAKQLGKSIFGHLAFIAHFTQLDNKLFLVLKPTIQLTEDGQKAIFGAEEGTVITRLVYNKYNSSYYNNILFWAYKLSEGRSVFSIADGKIVISAKPVESKINVGISWDKPSSELMEGQKTEIEEK
jgi:hypothetical protein